MFKANVATILCAAVLLLSGCAASLNDFQKMSVAERADYVCERHYHVKQTASELDSVNSLVLETETVLANGYRTHKSCKQIPSVVPITDCVGLVCNTTTRTVYNTMCETIPVAIDAGLEKEKLQRYRSLQTPAQERYDDAVEDCNRRVSKMDAEDAFRYFQDTGR